MIQASSARLLPLAMMLALSAQAFGQTREPGSRTVAAAAPTGKITSAALWVPGTDFLKNARASCNRSPRRTLANCLIDEMTRAGAPEQAVRFSRQLYRYNGEFGVLVRFQMLGPVDMAKVFYPLRAVAPLNYGLLLVNGDPAIIDVDDLTKLDRAGLEEDPEYQLLKHNLGDLKLRGGMREGTAWDLSIKRPDGGQSFDIVYRLTPRPAAGRLFSFAHFSWDFAADGKFLGTRFMGGVGTLPS